MRILVVGSVIAAALIVAGGSAEAKIKCNKPSNCTDPAVVADARGGIEVACPCAGAANRKSYKSCTKTALRLAKTRLGTAFTKACEKQTKQALGNSTCGRAGFVTCNKRNRADTRTTCKVVKAAKCRGSACGAFTSCADACNPSGESCPTTTSTSTTTPPTTTTTTLLICGNGIIEGSEQCDPPCGSGCGVGQLCNAACECVTQDACACGTPDPTQLQFTSALPAVPNCGMLLNATGSTLLDLECGKLYVGGGGSAVPGALSPDMSQSVANVCCSGTTLTMVGATAAEVGGARANERCTSPGCLFGAPLPIPNPSSRPTSTCVINVVAQNAVGTTECVAGSTDLTLPLISNVYLTGDLDFEPANGIQPCPVCTTDDALDPSTSCPPGGQPCCQFGPDSGQTCTPATSEDIPIGYATSHDCQPPANAFLNALSIEFGLTSGSIQRTSEDLGDEPGRDRVFCGFCRDVDGGSDVFGTCQDGPLVGEVCQQRTDCGGGTCGGARRCMTSADCSQPLETCSQKNNGAFGKAAATTIIENGTPAGDLTDGATHAATLASIFCIPPTFDASVDGAGDLPGPGAVTIQGAAQLLP